MTSSHQVRVCVCCERTDDPDDETQFAAHDEKDRGKFFFFERRTASARDEPQH